MNEHKTKAQSDAAQTPGAAGAPGPAGRGLELRFHFETFALFHGQLVVQGWLFGVEEHIPAFHIVDPHTGARCEVRCDALSDDVARAHGPAARHCRFAQRLHTGWGPERAPHLELHVAHAQGTQVRTDFLAGALGNAAVHHTFGLFLAALAARAPGRVVEIGARARSGITRRHMVPPQHAYVGVDIRAGENVDVVLDAHELSRHIAPASVDAVFCFSVFEHLAMPWKLALEINHILKPGGIGFVMTHQSWPVHDAPWDYWRFSDQSWKALFNRHTGFALLDARMSDPAFIVPQAAAPGRLFAEEAGGYLQSAAYFQKVAPTALRWDVPLGDLGGGADYPA